jgi:hypothetical protein
LEKQSLFGLANDEEVTRFFRFALSIEDLYGEVSSDSDGSGTLEPAGPAISADRLAAPRRVPLPARQQLPRTDSYAWLFNKVFNKNVVESMRSSMMRRFGSTGDMTHRKFGQYKRDPDNVLRLHHFSCDYLIVDNEDAANRCLSFIAREPTLSVDTETAQPEGNEGISLVQIGTHTLVFLLQVCRVPGLFFQQLGRALRGKTLLHWGGNEPRDLDIVLSMTRHEVEYIDVQKKYMATPESAQPGLDTCMGQLLHGQLSLSKTWRLSGWDAPELDREQLVYATLDVVAVHVLNAAHAGTVRVAFAHDTRDCPRVTFHWTADDVHGRRAVDSPKE